MGADRDIASREALESQTISAPRTRAGFHWLSLSYVLIAVLQVMVSCGTVPTEHLGQQDQCALPLADIHAGADHGAAREGVLRRRVFSNTEGEEVNDEIGFSRLCI